MLHEVAGPLILSKARRLAVASVLVSIQRRPALGAVDPVFGAADLREVYDRAAGKGAS